MHDGGKISAAGESELSYLSATVTVTGSELIVNNGARLVVVGGSLTVSDGGAVTAANVATYRSGTIAIGSLHGAAAAAAGTINADYVQFQNGGTLVFNHTSTELTFSAAIIAPGNVLVDAGKTILTADNTFSGETQLNGGTLALSGVGSIANSAVVHLATGATLDIRSVTAASADIVDLASTGGIVHLDVMAESGNQGSATIRAAAASAALNVTQAAGASGVDLYYLKFSGWNDASNSITLAGQATNDLLTGSSLADNILGSDGTDTLQGRSGADMLEGGDDNDILSGGAGIDTLTGGNGNDRFYIDNALDQVIEGSGEGTADAIYAGGDYTLADTAFVELLYANAGNNGLNLTGNLLGNKVYGGVGNDTLHGMAGTDRLSGGSGNDTLTGGTGQDVQFGGLGSDTFVFDPKAVSSDSVRDFVNVDDQIAISASLFGTGLVTVPLIGACFI